jgi:quercetin dioxygenase-like cupin family protein
MVGTEEHVLDAGDVCCHPNGILHTIEAIEDSIVVETKAPAPETGSFLSI